MSDTEHAIVKQPAEETQWICTVCRLRVAIVDTTDPDEVLEATFPKRTAWCGVCYRDTEQQRAKAAGHDALGVANDSEWTCLQVAIAMLDARFLDGSHAIEYVKDPDPARIGPRQVSVTPDGRLVERWRGLRTGPGRLPRWAAGSGWVISADGSAGAWMPSIHDMTAACRLVLLADDDRAASLEWR